MHFLPLTRLGLYIATSSPRTSWCGVVIVT
jgi:hypothetical protein